MAAYSRERKGDYEGAEKEKASVWFHKRTRLAHHHPRSHAVNRASGEGARHGRGEGENGGEGRRGRPRRGRVSGKKSARGASATLVLASICAPLSRSDAMAEVWPYAAAKWRAVSPSCTGRDGRASEDSAEGRGHRAWEHRRVPRRGEAAGVDRGRGGGAAYSRGRKEDCEGAEKRKASV